MCERTFDFMVFIGCIIFGIFICKKTDKSKISLHYNCGHLYFLGGAVLLNEGLALQSGQETRLACVLVSADDDLHVIITALAKRIELVWIVIDV